MTNDDPRRFSPSTARNRDPILEVLRPLVAPNARVLEIASGSGEHAVHFAANLPAALWQPTDPDRESRASIDAWRAHVQNERIAPAIALDVTSVPWPVGNDYDLVLCINMIHFAPWAVTPALFAGAHASLRPNGVVVTYGPYKRGGVHTAPSNESFDARMRSERPGAGVRDMEEVERAATEANFKLREIHPMPANNFCLVFDRQ